MPTFPASSQLMLCNNEGSQCALLGSILSSEADMVACVLRAIVLYAYARCAIQSIKAVSDPSWRQNVWST